MKILCLGRLPQDLEEKLLELAPIDFIDRTTALPDHELIEALQGKTIILTEPQDQLNEKVVAAAPELKMIAQRAVGFDNINLPVCSQNNILVSNTPGVLDNATADLAFALLLACGRRIVEADSYVRSGQWTGFENDLLLGTEIFGKTIGIVGMGRIGYAMAKRCHAFSLKIIYSRSGDLGRDDNEIEIDERDKKLALELNAQRVSLETLLKNSNFVSVHCLLSATTTELIGHKEFSLMPHDCIFINTARGKIVDEQALADAIFTNKIKGAGLDVFYSEPAVHKLLLAAPNVVLAPHIGSATAETRHAMANLAVSAALEAFKNKSKPANLLNPDIWQDWLEKQ